jgi:hypothetical protein
MGIAEKGSARRTGKREHSQSTVMFARMHRTFQFLRDWLSYHSMLYRVVVNSRIGSIVKLFEDKVYGEGTSDYAVIVARDKNIHPAFAPKFDLFTINLDDEKIREGLRLTLDLLGKMSDFCRQHDIYLLMVLLPTKESVFASYIAENQDVEHSSVMAKILASQKRADATIKRYLENTASLISMS